MLVLEHYSRLRENVEQMEEKQKLKMIDTIAKRMKYYNTRGDESLDILIRHQAEGEYIEAFKSNQDSYAD